MPSLRELLDVATEAARLGGTHTLRYFNQNVNVELKSDNSPVTRADREAEVIVKDYLLSRFPTHSVLGEEHGTVAGDPDYQWVVDPIDGTKSFVHGVPLFTTLVGLQVKGRPAVGAIYVPALDEMASAAEGLGCNWNGKPCRVSTVDKMSQALLLTSDATMSVQRSDAYMTLAQQCAYARTWGDGYGYVLVATGRAEIMVDAKMNPWDCCALIPVITEAGGVCTSWSGAPTIHGGDLYACNAQLADTIAPILRAG